jgi:hypothetical protein
MHGFAQLLNQVREGGDHCFSSGLSNASIASSVVAHERTLMACLKTATSMITIGITIYKFLESETGKAAAGAPRGLLSPTSVLVRPTQIDVNGFSVTPS